MNSYRFKSNSNDGDEQGDKEPKTDHKSAIIMSSEQHDKLDLVTKILIYYKNLIKDIISKNSSVTSIEWLQTPKFYFVKEAESKVVIKILNYEINYGFQYYSSNIDDDCLLIYKSSEIHQIVTHVINIILSKSSTLLHGKKVKLKKIYFQL